MQPAPRKTHYLSTNLLKTLGLSIHVSIVEDDNLLLAHLTQLVKGSSHCQLAGSARNGAEAKILITENKTDVYLIDLGLPDIDGVELISLIKNTCPDARSMALSSFGDAKHMRRSICAGATGYLLKDLPDPALIEKIVTVYKGESLVTPSLVKLLFQIISHQPNDTGRNSDFEKFGLGARELEVMRLLVEGLSIFDIGDKLCISTHTVNQHLRSIYRKLDVHSRAKAVSMAFKHGFLKT